MSIHPFGAVSAPAPYSQRGSRVVAARPRRRRADLPAAPADV